MDIDNRVKAFLDKNTDGWEVYFERERSKSAKIERGDVKVLEGCDAIEFAVRVIIDGKIGFAVSNVLDLEVCERAIKIARISEECLNELPMGDRVNVEGIYDRRVEGVSAEFLFKCVEELVQPALDLNVNPSNGLVEFSCYDVGITNSNGLDLTYKTTFCSTFLECVYEKSSGFEMDECRELKIDFEFVGKKRLNPP